jgi:ABC-type uncharacterized transport system ATPase subunit|tara:strand:- start:459 stop:677 length:219 start_codon:yes stop_codon:yes gene_type:complete
MSLKELKSFVKKQKESEQVLYRAKLEGMPTDELQKHIGDLSGTVRTNPKKNMATRVFLRRSDGGIARKTRVF